MEIFVFILGICIGSFLNVVIYRTPKDKSIMPSSKCPHCNNKIKFYHNIPIISFLLLKGRCAYCKEKISIQYPIVELLGGILAILVYNKFNTFDIFFVVTFLVFSLLLALSVIDIKYKAIPDSVSLSALFISIFHSSDILNNLTNALLIIGAMSILRWYVSFFLKKEAMGEGDLIIGGIMGSLLGVKLALMAIFISALIAIIPSLYLSIKKHPELPYIPFLSIAVFLVWYFSEFFDKVLNV